jgi:hypothetical protein
LNIPDPKLNNRILLKLLLVPSAQQEIKEC